MPRMRGSHRDAVADEIEAETQDPGQVSARARERGVGPLARPRFVKSFLRTYAKALGVDGKALVEEYRLNHEPMGDGSPEPIVSSPQHKQGAGRPPSGPSRGYLIVLGVVLFVIVLLVVGLLTGSGGGSSKNDRRQHARNELHRAPPQRRPLRAPPQGAIRPRRRLTLSLKATGAVYVCLIGDGGHKLIAGADLHAGSSTSHLSGQALSDHARQQLRHDDRRRHPPDRCPPPARPSATPSPRPAVGDTVGGSGNSRAARERLARGGIIVTGTEVLTGSVSDRNGPGSPNDCMSSASISPTRSSSAIVAATSARRSHSWRRNDVAARHHQRRSRTDRRRSHRRGRRALPAP